MNRLKLILLVFFSILSLTTLASDIDSLKNEIESNNIQQVLSALEKLADDRLVPAKERIDFSRRAILVAQKLNRVDSEAFSRRCLGIAYADIRDYIKAVESLHISITLYESINDKMGKSMALTLLGRTYFYLNNLDESTKCLEEALQIRIELGDESEISRAMINIGNIKAATGNFEEAMELFKKALKIEKKQNNLTVCSQCYNNIANVHLALGEIDEVLPYRIKALEIDRELKDEWQIALKTYNLAEYYLMINEAEKAYPYIIESKDLAKKLDDKELENDNVELLSWYYKLINDYPNALKYLDQYSKSNKEIFSKELSDKVGEMNALYESEKSKRENQTILLKLEDSKKQKSLLLFLFTLILVVSSFIFYLYYKKKKYNQLLQNEVLLQTNSLRIKNNDLLESTVLLEKAKEKAEESDKLKTAFLQNISHEIRTPLNGIVGFSRLMVEQNRSPEELKSFSNIISRSSNKLIDIVSDVIEISQIQSNSIQLKNTKIDIVPFITNTVFAYTEKAEEKNITFLFKQNIPFQKYIVQTDIEKLKKILSHLIDNALKFTHRGSVEITCTVKDENLQISVSDTGIGISNEIQQVIFKPFHQVETELNKNYGGTGLGLSLVKSYVELLHGSLTLKSEIDIGTTISVSIPLSISLKEPDKKGFEKTKNKVSTILIAEDEYVNYMYLEELLNDSLVKILHATNGQEALDFCRNDESIGLVLMDIKMPIMDGHTASKLIKDLYPALPIIAQSAYTSQQDIKEFITVFDDYISKPIDAKIFKQKMMEYIG